MDIRILASARSALARIPLLFSLALVTIALPACVSVEKNPGSATKKDENVALGNQFAKDGLFREAAASYQRAVALDPENHTAHRNLGMVLVKLGDYKRAALALEKSMGSYRNDFDANWYLGEAYRGANRFTDAIFNYQAALKIKPNQTRALKSLAWSYFKVRYYSAALDTAKELRKRAPNDTQAALILARVFIKTNRSDLALKLVQQAKTKSSPSNLPYLLSVEGDVYLGRNDCVKANDSYRKALETQPLLAGALLGHGRCLYRQKDIENAAKYLVRAARIRPSMSESFYFLGRIYEAKDPQKALKYYKQFYASAAKDPQMSPMIQDMKRRYAQLERKNKTSRN